VVRSEESKITVTFDEIPGAIMGSGQFFQVDGGEGNDYYESPSEISPKVWSFDAAGNPVAEGGSVSALPDLATWIGVAKPFVDESPYFVVEP
jgi:hypothetical protein